MKSKTSLPILVFIILISLFFFLLPSLKHSRETLLPAVQKAEAMTIYNVNSTLDQPDANDSDGLCASTPSGLCTLRAAITEANKNVGPHTIVLQPNTIYTLTIAGVYENQNKTGDLDIVQGADIKIEVANGGMATIDGGGDLLNDNVMHIYGKLQMTGVAIQNGRLYGIENTSYGNLTLLDVTVQNNGAAGCGGTYLGGIFNGGNLLMNRTAVVNNSGNYGGGILNRATLVAVNSVISGNKAQGSGGGILNEKVGSSTPATLILRNTTIAYNRAGICVTGFGGGIVNSDPATTNIINSIIAGNNRGLIFPAMDDCYGALNSEGYTLIQTFNNCHYIVYNPGDLFGLDPLLTPLQNNGGLTLSHGLMTGSPAIDAGSVSGCKDQFGILIAQDQRGTNRHLDGGYGTARCDMGAYEYDPALPPQSSSYSVFMPVTIR